MRRIIIRVQDLLNPDDNKEKVYEYDINETNCFERSFQDFGISTETFEDYEVLLGSLSDGSQYELRIITLRNDSRVVTYKEILL